MSLCSAVFVCFEYFHYGLTGKMDWYDLYVVPSAPVIDQFLNMSMTGSVYTTIALSIDRVIGVTKPLQWPHICTRFRVKMVLTFTFLWSILINVPLMLERDLIWEGNNLIPVNSAFVNTYFHSVVYLQFIHPALDSILPVIIITTTTGIIISTVRRQQAAHRTMTSGEGRRASDTNRITAQVVFISFFTLASRAFRAATFVVMEQYDTLYINQCPLYCGILASLNQFFNILNATVNFFCYCYFGQKFRRCFLKKYGCVSTSSVLNKNTKQVNTARVAVVSPQGERRYGRQE